MISQDTIDTIVTTARIEEVISQFVSLKKRGVNYLGVCPFHNEKTPSFTVSPSKGLYKCFGCGKAGNVVSFMMELESLTYPEALRFLASLNSIKIIDDKPEAKSLADELREINLKALNFFSLALAGENSIGSDYFSGRGISTEIVKAFRLGQTGSSGNSLSRYLKENKLSPGLCQKAGLLSQNDHSEYYDYFRQRVIFPFLDLSGRVIGFSGRSVKEDDRSPKYLNSPETPLFHKGKTLFGLYQAKSSIIREEECLVVEGPIDVLSFHQAGITNTVCTSGTALTSDQLKLISRFTNNVTLVFDGDSAGQKAAERAIEIILKEGLNLWIITLPPGEDPDSFARKNSGEDLRNYLENNRRDFVDFKLQSKDFHDLNDSQLKSGIIHELLTYLSFIQDEVSRDVYIQAIADRLKISRKPLEQGLKKKPAKPKDVNKWEGFFAFDSAKEAIGLKDETLIYGSNNTVIERHLENIENVVGLPYDKLNPEQLSGLSSLSRNVRFMDAFQWDFMKDESNPLISLARQLVENQFNVLVNADSQLGFTTQAVSFVDYFVSALISKLNEEGLFNDDKSRKITVEKSAELISKLDNTSITLKIPWAAKKFGMTTANFNKIIKPFLDKRKNRSALQHEDIIIDDTRYVFDIENLPDYVEKKFFYKYGFFAAQNRNHQKIFYVFRTQDNTLVKVGNFFMEPLFQVFDLDPLKNKRVVKLNHAELGRSEYVEMPSSGMMDFSSFKKFLWNQGGYVFSKGKNYHHEVILESIALQFPKCFEFNVFGWQSEGFFAFSNGIYAEKTFMPVDELGLVAWKENTYYSPAFSKIFKDQRQDNDKYANDRYLVFKEDTNTSWEIWCKSLIDVYKYNNNGHWAIIFTMLAAYRSVIFPIDRFFTSLFFIGPTDSGKSRIAESIRAPFMYGAPLFNLNSGTDAAFFTVMERYRDVPVIFEEYNDYQISDVKFQGLKAAVYDNEGKTKRKDASTKELDISQVNCAPLLLGQEAPERDDGSLSNRCVLCHVPKKDDWSEEEIAAYQDLKDREKKGLTNIAIQIFDRRSIVQQNFAKIQRQVHKQMKEDLNSEGSFYQTRILNTISLFLTIVKLFEEHAPELPMPFSYNEFYLLARQKIISQSEAISQSNKLSIFFDTIALLLNREHGIIQGREFKIEEDKILTVQKSKNESKIISFDKPTKILYLRLNILHQMYKDMHKAEALKPNALLMYLRDHPAYLGPVKSTRFEWKEQTQVDTMGFVERKLFNASTNTSALALDYAKIGIDLEKFKEETGVAAPADSGIPDSKAEQLSMNMDEEPLPF
ncbi:MAG: DNA primase [Bacteroidetes bacterium]|nr:DNA primase [Bacteroidota bacterium]